MVFLQAGAGRNGVTVAGAKNVTVANTIRQGMTFQNTSDTEMFVTEDGTDASAANGYKVLPNIGVNISTNARISVYCTVAGKTYASTEF